MQLYYIDTTSVLLFLSLYSCFIGDRRVFFGAFLGPILAVLLFNTVMFVVVIKVVVRNTLGRMTKQNQSINPKSAFKKLISITGIMSLFGLTWIFGALTISGASLPFQILFVVFNGFQGFFIFLFLCVFSMDARELWKECLSCGHYKSSTNHQSHQGTGKFTGGTRKLKAAAGTVTVALSVRKSEQSILSVASDHDVLKNPYVSEDQMSMSQGGSLTFGHSNKIKEGGDILCIANPQATDSLKIQPGEVQSPTLGSSKQVGTESSSQEIWGANAKISNNPTITIEHGLSQCGQV